MPKYTRPKGIMDLQFSGWEAYADMLNNVKFERMFVQFMRIENLKLAQLGATRLKQEIRAGNHIFNSPVTTFIKKSSKPLIDDGDLYGNVSGQITSDNYGFDVGTKKVTTGKARNLAHMLETGFTIKVTPPMRKFFFYLARASDGVVKPLRASTTELKVPGRPYVRQAFFDDKRFPRLTVSRWKHALHQTYGHFVDRGKAGV